MARQSSPPILAQIRNSKSPSEQIIALRALKNDIVGHQQKKEMWIGLGIVDPIVRIITSSKAPAKQNGKEKHDQSLTSRSLSEEEMVRLQALYVIGSLARGGPHFLGSLHSSSVLPSILANICPLTNPPQVALAALRALSNLMDLVSLVSSSHVLNTGTLADGLFSRPHITSLCRILSQSSPASIIQSQISLSASLVSKLCREERHQSSLANAGVLDALAARLASVVASQGLVIPGAELLAQKEGILDYFPPPAPYNCDLAGILEAIAIIISDSKLRASQLVYSNAIMAVFPSSLSSDFQSNRSTKAAWSAFNAADLSTRQSRLNAIDYLIPQILNQTKSAAALSAFPPLGIPSFLEHFVQLSQSKTSTWSNSPSIQAGISLHDSNVSDYNEPESPLIAYLIWLTRSTRGLKRLMAASVLTVLYGVGLTDKSREAALGLLIVPILVQLLDEVSNEGLKYMDDTHAAPGLIAKEWIIKECAPAVLAMLIVDSELLQKSAYDAGAISKLSKMIKSAYDPVLGTSQLRTWSPNSNSELDHDASRASQSSRPGQVSQPPFLAHKIKVRESALRAIAALVPFKDEYRKAIIEQGVIPYIVESLKTYPEKPLSRVSEKSENTNQFTDENQTKLSGYGKNPISVLIAACGAVRALSRSVSTLRTTLIDSGVAMPIIDLLQHSDIDVQISATAAVCNLVLEFSPMREIIFGAGVLKILCNHAHSGNVKLRLNALWALKHYVQSAGNDVKKLCLVELGQGWLVQLICDDTEDEALSIARSKPGAFGINGEPDEDVPMDQFEDDNESKMTDSIGALGHSYNSFDVMQSFSGLGPESSRGAASLLASARLAALRDLEANPVRGARKDDIAVQEQGLDIIRNLIGGCNHVGTSESSEMIDFLINALGQDQIFEILASKLRPKVINPFNKRSSTWNGETRVIPPQAEIIASVEYILVHIAASVPRHRQLVIAQTELLRLLVPQFSHQNKEVRLALCWLVINLTCLDDGHDGQACAARVQELKKLGFLSKLENLEHDCDLDVQQRAKTALHQMKQDC